VRDPSISLDGPASGPHHASRIRSRLGGQLHEWLFASRSESQMIGIEGGIEGPTTLACRSGNPV
jgi:hypothetical protein